MHLVGKPYLVQVFTGNSFLSSQNYQTFGVYQYDGQTYRYPKSEISTQYDTTGQSISTAKTYQYDLASRLPKEIISYGEVQFEFSSNSITDIGDDMVRSVFISTNTRPQKFLSEEKYDKDGNFVDKVVNFYDNLPF